MLTITPEWWTAICAIVAGSYAIYLACAYTPKFAAESTSNDGSGPNADTEPEWERIVASASAVANDTEAAQGPVVRYRHRPEPAEGPVPGQAPHRTAA